MVDLQMMLEARDRREMEREKNLRSGWVCITLLMNIPGQKKTSPTIQEGFKVLYDYVINILQAHMMVHKTEVKFFETGPEAFFMVEANAKDLKVLMMSIENAHPLGRIADLDVYDENNQPLKRIEYGEHSRKCLVCEEYAKICARKKSHSPNLILAIIECSITNFFNKSHREIVL